MSEKIPLGAHPWQVATPLDIARLVERGEVARAREWCDSRLIELKKILSDIDKSVAETKEMGVEKWQIERVRIAEEVEEWEDVKAILAMEE